MSDPAHALQTSVYAAIKTLADSKVFHRVPDKTTLPYIYIGDDDFTSEYDATDLTDCSVEVHVFASTKPQLKTITGQVRDALDKPLTIEGFRVYEWSFESTRYMRDPDGLTEHSVTEFRYLVGATE